MKIQRFQNDNFQIRQMFKDRVKKGLSLFTKFSSGTTEYDIVIMTCRALVNPPFSNTDTLMWNNGEVSQNVDLAQILAS